MRDYLYAIVDRLPGAWQAPRAGVADAPVLARRLSGMDVVCSPLETVPPPGPKTLALHHDVVDSLMEADAVLPVRYGLALARRDLDAWLTAQQRPLRAALAQVQGCVEMSVKLLALDRQVGRAGPVDGELRALGERLAESAGVDQWRYRPSGTPGAGAASVAFLVPRLEVPALLARIAPIASRAVGVAVVPTGPWPAYSFVPVLDRLPPTHAVPAPASARGVRLPIDTFFRSLAEANHERSIDVVLSGMGSDGTLGLRAIKEHAGASFVQSPGSAKFDGMPRSAIEAGRLAISLEPVLVGDTVYTALDLVRPQAAARGVTLGGEVGDDECYVTADRQRLQQVLLNLLSNAVKYNREGGRASVRATVDGDRVQIDVLDTGAGNPPEKLALMFTPFERLGAEQTGIEGTGLGLATCYAIARQFGGHLGVYSEVGVGTTMCVRLPRQAAGQPVESLPLQEAV